jgi:hypothetical protein
MSTGYFVTLVGDAVDKPGGKAMVKQTTQDDRLKEAVYRLVPAVIGGIFGGVFWKQHRVLGVLGGIAAGGAIYPIAKGEAGTVVRDIVPTAAGIYGSLKWRAHPAWGFILPDLGANIALSAIDAARK